MLLSGEGATTISDARRLGRVRDVLLWSMPLLALVCHVERGQRALVSVIQTDVRPAGPTM